MADLLRTTSFRVTPKFFGEVFAYRAGGRFQAAWKRVEDAKELTEFRRLPYSSLATLLRLRTANFVRLQVKTGERDPYFIVSRNRVELDELRDALLAWEYTILPTRATGVLAEAADDLVESTVRIADNIRIRPGHCFDAEKWVWEAALWEVAHKLASSPLTLDDGNARLRIDTEGGLLTWDRLVRGGKNHDFLALHRVVPKVITVPGVNDPVIHLESSLVRLTNRWSGKTRSAWIDQGGNGLLLLVKARTFKRNGDWTTVWADLTAEVVRRASVTAFPEPATCDLASTDHVRARLMHTRSDWPIGKGPGQTFHEAVGLHARRVLGDARPLEMSKARRSLERAERLESTAESLDAAIQSSGGSKLRVVCLYGTDDMRPRMVRAIEALTANSAGRKIITKNDEVVSFGSFEVVFRSPRGAKDVLTSSGDAAAIRQWTREALAQDKPSAGRVTAALVETSNIQIEDDGDSDPKYVIRRAAAELGVVTQFLSDTSSPSGPPASSTEDVEDYGGDRASWDLLRSAGVFVRRFPHLDEGIPAGTWLLGAYAVKRQDPTPNGSRYREAGEGYVISVVAAQAGTGTAMGFTRDGSWMPLGPATANFLAVDHDLNERGASRHIENAIQQLLVRDPSAKVIVFVDAAGCRRFWAGLQDTGTGALPSAVTTQRVAVMRVRADVREVPRPSGTGAWPADGLPQKPGTINAVVRLNNADWDGAWYYASTPRSMAAKGGTRKTTRYTCDKYDLRNDWHALNLTEFCCRHAGPFGADDLYELSALLCRIAPTWDGTLNWPSPLHLAKAIVLDHPGGYIRFADNEGDGDA